MRVRRSYVLALVFVLVLAVLGGLGVVFGPIFRPRHDTPEGIDRGRLRAEMAARRARGEGVAVKTVQEVEWEQQQPGVEFVVQGDALSGVVELERVTASGDESIAKLGGMGARRLLIQPEIGTHTFRIRMGGGSQSFVVPVEPHQLTRVVITLTAERTVRESVRKTVTFYDATVVVDPPHPAGPQE